MVIIRRWILASETIDLSQPVSSVAPKKYISAVKGSKSAELKRLFSSGKEKIPLIDEMGILVGLVTVKSG